MKPKTLDNILVTLRELKPILADRYGLRSIGVFGSYVRGSAGPNSDLDVLVEYERPPTLFEFVRLQNHLREITGVEIDLVMKSALKPKIGEQILTEVVAV